MRMKMKVGLIFAYMNLKKLAMMKQRKGLLTEKNHGFLSRLSEFIRISRKMALGFTS